MTQWQNGKMTKTRGQKAEDKKPRTKSRGTQDVLLKKLHMKKVRIFAKNAKKCKFAKRK
jgi:hypothetical protein